MATNLWKYIRSKAHGPEQDARQKTAKELLSFKKTSQYGFPNRPSALAYDAKLNVIAIGTRSGSVKIYGAPGVECYAQHDNDSPVTNLIFLPGQGRFISVCEDNTLYLWEINSQDNRTTIECINRSVLESRLKKISAVCLSSFYDQLYLGTEGGNIYVLDVNSFVFVEAAVIHLDAATQSTEGIARVAPGPVEAVAEHPTDSDQLLIGYSKGLVVLWDLKEKRSVHSYWAGQQLESVCWVGDGSRFVTSHNDGSYVVWDPSKPTESLEKPNVVYGPFPCKPIPKMLWRTTKGPNPFLILSGGMPRSRYGDHQTVTVMQGEKHVVFDFTSKVVDFLTIGGEAGDSEEPRALIVLLEEELIAVDLTTDKWPLFQLPYLFVIHSSSITTSHYVGDVSPELWTSLTAAGRSQTRAQFSQKPWPISGGLAVLNNASKDHEMLLTGHEDGSVRFWDVSGAVMKLMYTLTTANLFRLDEFDDGDASESPAPPEEEEEGEEWPPFRKTGSFDPYSDDPRLAVQKLEFCTRSHTLLVAGTAGQIVVLDFKKTQTLGRTIEHLTVSLVGDRDGFVWKGHSALKLRSSVVKSESGFQPQLVVQLMPPATCTSMTIHSDWHLFGAGTAHGFMLVDYMRRKPVITRCTLTSLEAANGVDQSMTRRGGKSFKKSLRESFRRMRRGRSQMQPAKKVAPGDQTIRANAHVLEIEDTRPVERQIEARPVDNEMASVVRCMQLVSCYILNNVVSSPTFWAGTNSGSVFIYTLVLPLAENRKEEDVHASLSKEIQLRHHAPVVHISVVDSHGAPVAEKASTKDSSGDGNVQKVIICSEEQFKVFYLPSLKPFTKYKLTAHEGSLLRTAREVKFLSKSDNDFSEYCLTCLTNQGDISIFSLPGLSRYVKQDCIRREDCHGISTLTFTKSGQGFYQKSPSEFQRFTLSSHNAVEALCTIPIDEHARPNRMLLRAPNSPSSRVSSRAQSPRLPAKSLKSSPESGISVNNTIYTRNVTTAASGVRSPDTLNLNESLRSEAASVDISVDSVRIFSDNESQQRNGDYDRRIGSPTSQTAVSGKVL
ncbi:Lethal(2) giant larvae protein-like protein 1 [Hypsibius exemplaris]|uniref:Lethal(2) giant larvae protein-like protein 1 n=1 Tax=Hypsibius exemplaris TaxID=2072580 RepID=A0A1W0XE27_HYPEX|nr:Lethal(2) giant larvae protein-like protein 1 [Hypsibius exemplaris]